MTFWHCTSIFLSFVLLQLGSSPSDAEFKLAYVGDHILLLCACMRELPACNATGTGECNCGRKQSSVADPIHFKSLTVWYTSPLKAARLLNNSEVRHLTLVNCDSVGSKWPPFDHFTVQRLERLTVLYPPELRRDVMLGRDMAAPHQEEARIAVIHAAVLLSRAGLKAYTVKTEMDGDGVIPFPNVFMSPNWLPKESYIFVTFVY